MSSVSHPTRPFSRHIVSSIIYYIGYLSRGSLTFSEVFLFRCFFLFFADWTWLFGNFGAAPIFHFVNHKTIWIQQKIIGTPITLNFNNLISKSSIRQLLEEKRKAAPKDGSPHNTKGRRVYSDATHLLSENDLCKPLSSRTVIPRPLGPVKLATFTPLTARRMFLLPFLGYKKETLRSLRLW